MGGRKTAGTLLPVVRCLSLHADYACRHSGACCTAGWHIPVDEELHQVLETARTQGRLLSSGRVLPVLDTSPCAFFDDGTRLCVIHRDLGAPYKPSSCRHFPRLALLDGRGVSLTLSHFCPTAAAMLFREDVALGIVEAPPAFAPADQYEGLDARHVMPPLLRPGMLWDLDGYSAWEEEAVSFLGRTHLPPDAALDHLRQVAEPIQQWSPGDRSLRVHVQECFGMAEPVAASRAGAARARQDRVINRYLAARLFASWIPYRSERLTALIDDLVSTRTLFEEEAARAPLLQAIRATELRVVHGC